jgi:ribonuclease E
VSVGRVLEGAAYATLADDAIVASNPITFEAEAEKPTRASRSKKDVGTVEVDELSEPLEAEATVEDEEPEPTPAEEVVADGDGPPKKKRTRRGTRGGRSRKKPAAAAAASPDGDGEAPADETNGRPAPRIHVPPSDLATTAGAVEAATDAVVEAVEPENAAVDGTLEADELPKRKRSRRGSRGGKRRRKPAAEGTDAVAPVEVAIVDENAVDAEPPEYVPMSEWIDDFDSRSRV